MILRVDEKGVGLNYRRPRNGIDTILGPDLKINRVVHSVDIVDQVVCDLNFLLRHPVPLKPSRMTDLEGRITGKDVVEDFDVSQIRGIKIATTGKPILGISRKITSMTIPIECIIVYFDIFTGIISAPSGEEYSGRAIVVHQVVMNLQVFCVGPLL